MVRTASTHLLPHYKPLTKVPIPSHQQLNTTATHTALKHKRADSAPQTPKLQFLFVRTVTCHRELQEHENTHLQISHAVTLLVFFLWGAASPIPETITISNPLAVTP